MMAVQQPVGRMAEPSAPYRQAYWPAERDLALSEHTVGSLLRERATQAPDTAALVHVSVDDGAPRRWTYRQLLDDALRIAAGLRRRVAPGSRVALWAPNLAEWPILEYAAALAGLTLVTLNPTLSRGELRHALALSRSAMLLHADSSRGHDMTAVVADCAPSLPELHHIVSMSQLDELREDRPLPAGPEPVSSRMPAQIQFTSGTTGSPKAVVLSHQGIVNVARFTFELLEVRSGSVVVSPLPMFHTAGCVVSCLGPLWCHGTFVLLDRFEPRSLIETLRRERGNVLTSVPTVLAAMLREAQPSERLPVLDSVLTGAAPVRTELILDTEAAFSTTVFNLYGQTEMAPVVTLTRPQDPAAVKAMTVGRPLPHLECKIVDRETGTIQSRGESGEICVRGYQQMVGYFDDDVATTDVVDSEGWLHTGDLGDMDATGSLRIIGRLKELIIRGGENIAPDEIEAWLMQYPGVRGVAVVGVPDAVWGERVGAVLQLAPGQYQDLPKWREHCGRKMSPHKVPELWYVVDEIPTTESGKIRKTEIRRLIEVGSWTPVGSS